jgi:hypothetical protein
LDSAAAWPNQTKHSISKKKGLVRLMVLKFTEFSFAERGYKRSLDCQGAAKFTAWRNSCEGIASVGGAAIHQLALIFPLLIPYHGRLSLPS